MFKHLRDWATIYFWLPLSLLSIWLFSKLAYVLTGRRPQENMDFIVGFSWNLIRCVFLIFFVEILRQQTGKWWTPEKLEQFPHLAWIQAFTKAVALCVFAYMLVQ